MCDTAAYWVFGTHGHVEVDDTGNIRLAVRSGTTRLDSRVNQDGFVRADVANVAALQELLAKAKAFQTAVFPQAEPGRADLEFTWQERADAYRLMEFHHKINHQPAVIARSVTDFLRDWKREQSRLGRAGIPEEMDAYAERWEQWW